MRRRLIVVSNRGPVTYTRAGGERVTRRGGGGLVTALSGLFAHHDVTWIASAMSDEDRRVATEQGEEPLVEESEGGAPYRLRLVAHEPETYDLYYNAVCNGVLWFLQHYLWGLAAAPELGPEFRRAWRAYERANASFADVVCQELSRDPAASVWFHDYHLYLAPRLVRSRVTAARTMHFVHVPWAQPDYWHVLPSDVRLAIHESLLANDAVSFQTERWRRSFVAACEAFTGSCGTAHLSARPISIDAAEFDALKESAAVLAEEQALLEDRPEHLIVRVDRVELSKNVVRGFHAYGLLLERRPELVGRVRMLVLLNPSRESLTEYADYRAAIEREAALLNERFPRAVHLRIGDNFAQSVAAYKQFDVLFVNPIFDGMNLVAKEAPLVNVRHGVVVLSENAGASEELAPWALTVNPFDVDGQAAALHAALTMGADERRRRHDGIAEHVREHDLEAWTAAQLSDLDRVAEAVASRR